MTQPTPSLRPASALALLTVLAMSLLLSACSVLPKATPLRTFMLPDTSLESAPRADDSSMATTLPLTLRVDTPSANTLLEGVRMLVQPNSEEIKVYEGTRWKDRAPILVQDRLINALRRDGRLTAIIGSNSPARNEVLFSSQLSGFHSRYRNNLPEAVIELSAQLISSGPGSVIATRRFSISQPADDVSIEAVVQAFGKAAEQLDQQVVDWTISELNNHLVRP